MIRVGSWASFHLLPGPLLILAKLPLVLGIGTLGKPGAQNPFPWAICGTTAGGKLSCDERVCYVSRAVFRRRPAGLPFGRGLNSLVRTPSQGGPSVPPWLVNRSTKQAWARKETIGNKVSSPNKFTI